MRYRDLLRDKIRRKLDLIEDSHKRINEITDEKYSAEAVKRLLDTEFDRISAYSREIRAIVEYRNVLIEDGYIDYNV